MKHLRNILNSWYMGNSFLKNKIALNFYTIYYLFFYNDYSKIFEVKNKLISSNFCKNPILLFFDLLSMLLFWGFVPSYYSTYGFYNKSLKQRLTFCSSIEDILFSSCINNISIPNILSDKARTYRVFKDFFNRDQIVIDNYSDYNLFLSFINKNQSFFCKPQNGSCGHNSRIIHANDKNSKVIFNELISTGPYVIEELVKQCKEMAAFNPSSINTVRTTMIRTKKGTELLFGFIRCGRAGQVVDNGGAGGIIVPYNPDNGYISKYGFDENGNIYEAHPDSNIKFYAFQIPRFNEIKDLSLNLMKRIPEFKYVGWDIAIGEDKLYLMEGNCRPQLVGLEALHNEGFKKEIRILLSEKVIPNSLRIKQQDLFT